MPQQHRAALLTRWQQERWLRQVDRVGEGVCLSGRPQLINDGQFTIGRRFFLASSPTQSHIVAMRGAELEIGDDVSIGYGAAITAQSAIRIGGNTRIGPFAVIMDGDFHRPGDRDASGEVAPISIGADVVIGARVTILRGADVGRGAHIKSGSMVSGTVPPGAVVGGVPARALQDAANTDLPGVAELIQRVLGLVSRPAPTFGPNEIPEWDSLGTLRLLLAIEETYGVIIREEEVHSARTVAALTDLVDTAKAR